MAGRMMIDFRHSGAVVLTTSAVIMCIGCGRYYLITGNEGIVREVYVYGTEIQG
jgi:hypothetical protein